MTSLVVAVVFAGAVIVILGMQLARREAELDLADAVGLADRPGAVRMGTAGDGSLRRATSAAAGALERLRPTERLHADLDRAHLPVRPGEFLLMLGAAGIGAGIAVWLVTGRIVVAVPFVLAVPMLARSLVLGRRIARRMRALEEQLPDALSMIAGSLSAGHTFLRAVEMLVEEADAPLSDELGRVVVETRLGAPLVDALERMAQRVDVEDVHWVVRAIRIQQTVGGALGELLSTLADFMRSRQEVRREVKVLTAEGKTSAYVLGALPIGMIGFLKTTSPGYLDPMFSGGGLLILLGALGLAGFGIFVILRMAKVDV